MEGLARLFGNAVRSSAHGSCWSNLSFAARISLEKPEIPVFFECGKPNPTIWAFGDGIYHPFMVIDGE